MPSDSPFLVEVRDIPTHRRIDVPGALVGESLKGLPMREALEAPEDAVAGGGVLDVELYADGTHVFASGTIKGWLEVACSRCVGPVKLALDEPVRVTFMPRSELAAVADDSDEADATGGGEAAEDGAEVGAAEIDVFPYDGEKIDLEPLVREQFVLAIPYAPLCSETCKGLCQQCGIDRNSATCSCEPPIDPRLAALKGLKIPS